MKSGNDLFIVFIIGNNEKKDISGGFDFSFDFGFVSKKIKKITIISIGRKKYGLV